MQMPPGSAMPSSLAATLTPSPRMSSPSIRMSPRLIPILNSIRRSTGTPSFRWAITACTATAHSTASTTEGNSSNTPSPVLFTRRPPCFATRASVTFAVFAEGAGGADLVEAHEPRVACDVSRDYGGEPASDTSWVLLFHGD